MTLGPVQQNEGYSIYYLDGQPEVNSIYTTTTEATTTDTSTMEVNCVSSNCTSKVNGATQLDIGGFSMYTLIVTLILVIYESTLL